MSVKDFVTTRVGRQPAFGYGLAYGAAFLVMGAAMPYMARWLEHRGMAADLIGAAMGAGMIARFAGAVLGGYWADRTGDPRRVFQLAALSVAGVYLLHLMVGQGAALFALTVLAGAATAPLTPLLEVNAMAASRRGGFSYGAVRSVGSASFVAASIVVGMLVDAVSLDVVIVWLCAAALGCAWGGRILPARPAAAPDGQGDGGHARLSLAQVGRYLNRRPVLLAFAASGLIQASHGFYYTFSTIAWMATGYSPTAIGLFWGWGVVAEILFLVFLARRWEVFGPAGLLMMGAAAGLIRWSLMALEPPWPMVLLLQTLHAGTYGAAHMGIVLFVARHVAPQARATAQALNSGLTFGGFLAASTAVSGWLYTQIGSAGYGVMAVFAGLGLAFAILLQRDSRRGGAQP